ncbi:MAG TPA: helix-turn-helix domain-containing protein, partial [Bacillota bacterium]|nr:helix-turn-helix domain-containing protein [Bacillota bacterium]
LRVYSGAVGKNIQAFSAAAQQKLLSHHWPGNVRELRNAIERAAILETGDEIQARNLPDFYLETRLKGGKSETAVASGIQSIDEILAQFERELIINTLEQCRYNLSRTADQLKISRHALRYRMQRLGIHGEVEMEDEYDSASEKEMT